MFPKHALAAALMTLLLANAASAQEATPPQMTPEQQAMMEAYQKAGTPGAEHKLLASSVGSYDLTVKSWHSPDAPPTIDTGTATRKMILGDRIMVEDVSSQMMGQSYRGQGLHGFDNVTGQYWATWNDNMTTGLMVSQGSCDAQLSCKYTGTYHDPVSKKPTTTRMSSQWTDKNTEVLEMYAPGPDGKEAKMMEITYKKRP